MQDLFPRIVLTMHGQKTALHEKDPRDHYNIGCSCERLRLAKTSLQNTEG